ncbi:cytidylate kinase family protein, partial [Massilicoli timonensis]
DKKRARYYQFYTEQDWGNKANYDLCINTTNTEIKKIVAAIEKFIV